MILCREFRKRPDSAIAGLVSALSGLRAPNRQVCQTGPGKRTQAGLAASHSSLTFPVSASLTSLLGTRLRNRFVTGICRQ